MEKKFQIFHCLKIRAPREKINCHLSGKANLSSFLFVKIFPIITIMIDKYRFFPNGYLHFKDICSISFLIIINWTIFKFCLLKNDLKIIIEFMKFLNSFFFCWKIYFRKKFLHTQRDISILINHFDKHSS